MTDIDNVLKEIFQSNEAQWKPSEKIPVIQEEISKLHSSLKTFLENSDFDLLAILQESTQLRDDSKELIHEMKNCQREIEEETMAEILKSIENHDEIMIELERISIVLNIVHDIANCNQLVKDFEECKKSQSFSQAVKTIRDLLQILDSPAEGFSSLTMYHNIKITADLIWENLLQDIQNHFSEIVNWISKPEGKDTFITVNLNIFNTEPVLDVIQAMAICNLLPVKIAEFTDFYFNQVLVPVINQECFVCLESDEQVTISLINTSQSKPTYDVVIPNVRALINFVDLKFSVINEAGHKLMQMFSEQIREDFRNVFIKDCLIDTVPNNMNDLQTYEKVTNEIQVFQDFLVKIRMFPNQKFSLLDYLQNIDVIFADKSSQFYLETARTIMMKDLSVSMSIGVEFIPEETSEADSTSSEYDDALMVLQKTLPRSLFYFPRCMISKSAQELLDLIHMMLEQAVQCPDVVSKKLYVSARLVFELYDAVVPYHHENFLQTIPQYVALFHNNCMYLAHHLQTFGDEWAAQLADRELHCAFSFVDLVEKVRDLGYKYLTMHMQQQRKQILDNIRSSDLNCMVVKDVLGENAEQAIRQCLRQLQLLKNVWSGVFPSNIFVSLMATLVNMFVDEIIHRVCTVEDISAEMATQITEIYTIVIKKAPGLFQNQTDIEEHVKSWVKLQELLVVVGGSLKDIEKRWADGAGPLALRFTTDELRNLIKALFQNTQFRANLLSKIK